MSIVILQTELFPDRDTLERALEVLAGQNQTMARLNIAELPADDDEAWDMVVREIMKAAKVVTI